MPHEGKVVAINDSQIYPRDEDCEYDDFSIESKLLSSKNYLNFIPHFHNLSIELNIKLEECMAIGPWVVGVTALGPLVIGPVATGAAGGVVVAAPIIAGGAAIMPWAAVATAVVGVAGAALVAPKVIGNTLTFMLRPFQGIDVETEERLKKDIADLNRKYDETMLAKGDLEKESENKDKKIAKQTKEIENANKELHKCLEESQEGFEMRDKTISDQKSEIICRGHQIERYEKITEISINEIEKLEKENEELKKQLKNKTKAKP